MLSRYQLSSRTKEVVGRRCSQREIRTLALEQFGRTRRTALNPALLTATLDPLYSYLSDTQLLTRRTVDARALDVLSRSRKPALVEGFDQ